VFGEMSELGLTGTEFGPLGFLPIEPSQRAEVLAALGMEAIGGFFPVVLHDPNYDPMPKVIAELDAYEAAGAKILVIAAEQPGGNYDVKRPEIDEAAWSLLLNNLKRIDEYAASRGVLATVHPHVGTMIETDADVNRVLEGCEIGFTFDTGHMFIGGVDPVKFSLEHADRVKHVHLKDCNLDLAQKVQNGEMTYYEATVAGMYTAVGYGDVDIRAIMTNLINAGYNGWFCLEQDKVINDEPVVGIGPIEDARRSVEFIKSVAASL
jgi:inosose dehydratase